MEKVLTQEEIDNMFATAVSAANSKEETPTVVPCDFRRAAQIDADQVRSLSLLHETFARNLTYALGAYLRVGLACNLVAVEHITFEEVLSRNQERAYVASLVVEPSNTLAALQLDLSLALPMIDLLLGGQGEPDQPKREITELEERIIEYVVRIICTELHGGWDVFGISFMFDHRQRSSELYRLMHSNEAVLALTFEITMPQVRGNLFLVLPGVVSHAVLRKLATGGPPRRAVERTSAQIRSRLLNCQFTAELSLDGVNLSARDLTALTPGKVVMLPRVITTPATLLVAGKPMFAAAIRRSGNLRAAELLTPTWREHAAASVETRQ